MDGHHHLFFSLTEFEGSVERKQTVHRKCLLDKGIFDYLTNLNPHCFGRRYDQYFFDWDVGLLTVNKYVRDFNM